MSSFVRLSSILLCILIVSAARSADRMELIDVKRIWDQAPHNAFTSLIRFQDQWVCAFREASEHAGGANDSKMRVLISTDANEWKSAALLQDSRGDIRDAKLSLTPDGRLMLLTAIRLYNTTEPHHQSLAWFTRDLKTWDGPIDVGEADVWLWGIQWHKEIGYSIGYSTTDDRFVRFYRTNDGAHFETVVKKLQIPATYPNENAIVFQPDDTARVLLRCDPDRAYLGTASPPYTQWQWKQSSARIGGPALMQTRSGKLLGAGRLYDGKVRTSLFWIDPESASISECVTLPSGGDTSYPGLVLHDGLLYISYYSSHESKTSVYLARCRIDDEGN